MNPKGRMLPLKLDRPLIVFDIESTGANRRADRIIDLALVKLLPDGTRQLHTFRFNPERPIPPEVTAIHGITDADVQGCPTFNQQARAIAALFEGCDLGGYNVVGFDIPLLTEEFARAGVPFDAESRRIFDAQRVFHKKVPRDLTAALAYYCGELHVDAHGAVGDVEATLRVMAGEMEKYPDLPRDLDGLDAYCHPRDPTWVDRTGKLKWVNGEVTINFGKNQGRQLRDFVAHEPNFIKWMLKADFPADTRDIVQNALLGKYPPPPAPEAAAPEESAKA